MKKYFKVNNLEEAGVIQYAEFEGEYVKREVNFYDRNFYEHKNLDYEWELSIDGQDLGFKDWSLSYLEFSPEEEISSTEFEEVWQKALLMYQAKVNSSDDDYTDSRDNLDEYQTPPLVPGNKKKVWTEQEHKEYWRHYWENYPGAPYHTGNDLFIPSTETSPDILFKYQTGSFMIKGTSTLDEPGVFYNDLIEWIENYLTDNPAQEICFKVDIDFFGTHDNAMLLDIFSQLPDHSIVEWYYETEDQEDEALDVAEMFEVPFYLINKITGEKYKVN